MKMNAWLVATLAVMIVIGVAVTTLRSRTPQTAPLKGKTEFAAAAEPAFDSVETFFAGNTCQEASDGCFVCKRLANDEIACSTAGTACIKAFRAKRES